MDDTNITISVIVPVYNVEKHIVHTMKSLLAQTFRDFEIILVDDGTPDCSIEAAETVLAQGGIPYHIIHQENAGQGFARNTGIKNSHGKWLYFLDSDDVILPCTLEHMMICAEKEDPDIVFSDYNEVYEYQNNWQTVDYVEHSCYQASELQENFLYRKLVILAPGTLYNKKFLLKNNLWFEKILWSEDQHFIWRMLSCVEIGCYLHEPLYQYYRHNGSIMSYTSMKKMCDSYLQIKKLPEYYPDNLSISRFIVPRWVMGTVNSAARMFPFEIWKNLWDELECQDHFVKLMRFHDLKVIALALLGLFSVKTYYKLLKKRMSKD